MADERFLGTGMKFPPEIDPATGRFQTVSGAKAVKESIYIILMTKKTERIVRPEFGSNIMDYTFMDTGETMLSILRRDITETILAQEPRVSNVDVTTDVREKQGYILVNVDYTVSATNSRDNLVFPFYLNAEETEMDEEEPEYYDPDMPNESGYYMEDGT